MKYVMFQGEMKGGMKQKIPIIFPDFMVHADVAEYMTYLLEQKHGYQNLRPVSAGSIVLGGTYGTENNKISVVDGVETSGKSDSLKLKSDPNDAAIISMYDYMYGLV